jgi:hypothetical protein
LTVWQSATETVAVLFCSLLLAFLSYELVERPFRGSGSLFTRRQIFAFGCVASIASASLAVVLFRSHGLPRRYDEPTRQLIAANLQRTDDFDWSCANWDIRIRSLNDINFCTVGQQYPHKILFFGDSLVQQLYPVIKQLSLRNELQNHGAVTAFDPGCLPDEHMNVAAKGFHCDTFARYALMRARQDDIDVVFVGFSDWWSHVDDKFCLSRNEKCESLLSRDALREQFFHDLSDEILLLRREGKHVIVSLPFPAYRDQVPDVAISNAVFGRFGLTETAREFDSPLVRRETEEVALRTGAVIFDPRDSLCPLDHCVTEIGGVSIYKDAGHLAGSAAPILAESLRNTLRQAAPVQ